MKDQKNFMLQEEKNHSIVRLFISTDDSRLFISTERLEREKLAHI
jgi:hypothetical protein